MSSDIRILLVADSHLGFDLPVRPRTQRRRRGHDFLANHEAALAPALAGEVDVVVHGGDVFDRPTVHSTVAYRALEPLRRVAECGVPVFVVPGNHERSRLPHARFASHPNLYVFDRPRTVAVTVRGTTLALSGFPYERRDVRTRFADLVEQTSWRTGPAAARVLCMHHCVEGATVGPADFTFTTASDVVRLRDVPREFAAVLSGHIHRRQVLTTDLNGGALDTPVLYPGSVERTSVAEIGEPKGFMVVRVACHPECNEGSAVARRVRWEFRDLPSRPMLRETLAPDAPLEPAIRAIVARAPHDAVVSIRVGGKRTAEEWRTVSSARLRAFVPETMNVELGIPREMAGRRGVSREPVGSTPQLELI